MTSRSLLLVAFAACGQPATPHVGDRATVPLIVEGNRPYIDVAFRKADGSTKTARFLVDTGGGGFLIVEPLAKELGLPLGEVEEEDGEKIAKVTAPPSAFVGDLPLELDPKRVFVLVGQTNIVPPVAPGHADGLFPGHVLAHYHVVFDYPKHQLTLAKPGALAATGTPLPMPVNPQSGFPRTELTIDGATIGMLLDTGASFTMISQAQLETWGTAHADWERHQGAFGDAKLLGGQTLETMIIPKAQWAGNTLVNVGMTSQQTGVFEKWMSAMTQGPVVGSLAGNVLTQFRVELDYPSQQLYLSK